MRTAALLFVAPAVHAFVAPSATAPTVRLAPLNVAPITVAALDDAVTAKVISAELQEMLDREWIEQDCHVVIGQNAADAIGALAKGLDDVGSILQHVGEQMTTDFPVDAYVGPWDCANFVSDTPSRSLPTSRVAVARRLLQPPSLRSARRGVRRSSRHRMLHRLRHRCIHIAKSRRLKQPPQKRQDVRDLRRGHLVGGEVAEGRVDAGRAQGLVGRRAPAGRMKSSPEPWAT